MHDWLREVDCSQCDCSRDGSQDQQLCLSCTLNKCNAAFLIELCLADVAWVDRNVSSQAYQDRHV